MLRRALEISGYERLRAECDRARRQGRRLGVGVACYVELTGVGPFEGATVRADPAGRLTVFTGVPSQGQGLEKTTLSVREIASLVRAAGACPTHPVVTG